MTVSSSVPIHPARAAPALNYNICLPAPAYHTVICTLSACRAPRSREAARLARLAAAHSSARPTEKTSSIYWSVLCPVWAGRAATEPDPTLPEHHNTEALSRTCETVLLGWCWPVCPSVRRVPPWRPVRRLLSSRVQHYAGANTTLYQTDRPQ